MNDSTYLFPVSFAQQRLWFLDQLLPGNPFYNIPAALRLKTRLNVAALRRSLNEIVRRHEALRTCFSVVDGQPVQVIAPVLELELAVADLGGIAEGERESEALRLAGAEAQRPFDLATGPLLRASLLQLADADYVLLLVMHHIVTDGWSMGVFFRELTDLYGAFVMGRPSPLPPLPIQYADYAVWQRQWLDGEVRQRQVGYWREQLAELPVLELPTDRPRPAVQSFRGGHHALRLEAGLTAGLRQLSQREGVTLFMTLLAAFQTLLHRYTGQDDIVVGSPIAGRNRAELEGLIGFFVNTLVLRTDMSGDPSFLELLRRVQQTAMGAYAHQDLPFEMLVEELQPERDLSRNPLFQVMIQLQTDAARSQTSSGEPPPFNVGRQTAIFDLSWSFWDSAEAVTGQIEYHSDLFGAATVQRMSRHFTHLLEGVVADPAARLSELPLLSETDRRQLLVDWNDTDAEFPDDACIHTLFERQVQRSPEAIAVVYGDQQIRYSELNARANQLAHYLRSLGVGPEDLAGVFVERTQDVPVALLGILKAGGAYVPLDPAYPHQRLALMLADANPSVVLTHATSADRLPSSNARVVLLDGHSDVIARCSRDNPEVRVTPSNLAYVIFTSGSTGRPKGVLVEHRGVTNVATAQQRMLGVGPQDRVLQFSSLSFDASVFEYVMALCSGAAVYPVSRELQSPGPRLATLLREHAITLVTLPPSVLAALPVEDLPQLRTITAAGEACPAELVRRSKGKRFFNLYGPTETSIWATVAECNDDNRKPPIGKPILNTQIYILDRHMQAVPVGVAGELHIGGVGVARGYLNRPELTAEKFVPDPFCRRSGARLYKTGDLARYLEDGSIEYLRRIDDQVKIRGIRIELGEIETVLRQNAGIREAAVMLREDSPDARKLVAYIVAGPQTPSESELRNLVRQELPEYMVPAAFVTLHAMPLTPNGKLDRRSLAPPEQPDPSKQANFVAPRTAVEERLAKIWSDVLGIHKPGVHDNFFDLGGHSLLATQLVSRLHAAFGIDVPLRRFFETPTIAGLAEEIEIARWAARGVNNLEFTGDEVEEGAV
jgi:amino acid adenylation domain-containing protein